MIRNINCIELRGDAKFIADKFRINQSVEEHEVSFCVILNRTVFSDNLPEMRDKWNRYLKLRAIEEDASRRNNAP